MPTASDVPHSSLLTRGGLTKALGFAFWVLLPVEPHVGPLAFQLLELCCSTTPDMPLVRAASSDLFFGPYRKIISPRGYSAAGSRRRRGCDVDIPRRRADASGTGPCRRREARRRGGGRLYPLQRRARARFALRAAVRRHARGVRRSHDLLRRPGVALVTQRGGCGSRDVMCKMKIVRTCGARLILNK